MSEKMLIRNFDEPALVQFLEFSQEPGEKVLYVVSSGGHTYVENIMAEIINEKPDEYLIKITEKAESNALSLLLDTTCKVEDISPLVDHFMISMFHAQYVGGGRAPKEWVKALEKTNETGFNRIQNVLTEKQRLQFIRYMQWTKRLPFLKKFMSDEIYLDIKQLKELLGDRLSVRSK